MPEKLFRPGWCALQTTKSIFDCVEDGKELYCIFMTSFKAMNSKKLANNFSFEVLSYSSVFHARGKHFGADTKLL